MKKPTRKNISSTNLIRVLKEIGRLSFKETETGGTYDFDLAISFLRGEGLDKNIIDQPADKRIGTGLPLNSERSVYSWLSNIVVRGLSIDIDSKPIGKELTGRSFQSAMLHIENCQFSMSDSNMPSFSFPWSGNFRFYRNELKYVGKYPEICTWIFVFGNNSRVAFVENKFHSGSIQINAIAAGTIGSNSPPNKLQHLLFLGNKGIGELQLNCRAGYYEFRGGNRIDQLDLLPGLKIRKDRPEHRFSFYFGPREKIDPDFHHNRHHRILFLFLRERANKKQDSQIVRTLDKYLDRIDYSLTKDQGIRFKDVKNDRTELAQWLGHWQDRFLYGWRKLSSDFYRSWLRPLSAMVLGYLILNAVPWLVVDGFTCSDYIAFCLRSPNKIPFYTDELRLILQSQYDCLPNWRKNILGFVGFLQAISLAMFAIAFRRAIAR